MDKPKMFEHSMAIGRILREGQLKVREIRGNAVTDESKAAFKAAMDETADKLVAYQRSQPDMTGEDLVSLLSTTQKVAQDIGDQWASLYLWALSLKVFTLVILPQEVIQKDETLPACTVPLSNTIH